MEAIIGILFLGLFVAGYLLFKKLRPTSKPTNVGGGETNLPNSIEPKKPEEHQSN